MFRVIICACIMHEHVYMRVCVRVSGSVCARARPGDDGIQSLHIQMRVPPNHHPAGAQPPKPQPTMCASSDEQHSNTRRAHQKCVCVRYVAFIFFPEISGKYKCAVLEHQAQTSWQRVCVYYVTDILPRV